VSQRVRLAVVSRYFGDCGGAERLAWRLALGVSRDSSYEVHVVTLEPGSPEGPFSFHRLGGPFLARRPLGELFFAVKATRVLREGAFRLVHSHELGVEADILSFGLPRGKWRTILGKPRRSFSVRDRLLTFLEKKALFSPRCRVILCPSNLAARALLDYYPKLLGRVRVFYPGVDLPTEEERLQGQGWRRELWSPLGWEERDPVALFIGNNFPLKGLPQAAQAVLRLRKRGLPLRLCVVGRGKPSDGGRAVADLQRQKAIYFAGLRKEGVQRYYAASDLLLFPSQWEAFGMVVLEAMAWGLPVILGPQVGAGELVGSGRNGWILKNPKDPEEIALGVEKLLDPAVRGRIAIEAEKTAERYRWETRIGELLSLYRQCLE
jgi:UDP-glucose:(heptosyl)LPS alpha-1,3-glucosyltransferase